MKQPFDSLSKHEATFRKRNKETGNAWSKEFYSLAMDIKAGPVPRGAVK